YSDFPFFFFQAEDGIRDFHVTGVQTCALPILQPTVDGWQLTLTDGSLLECDLAVLAEGGRSALREQLGVAVKHTPYGQTALIANVTPGKPHGGHAFERFTDDGPMALLPVRDNRCALIWS